MSRQEKQAFLKAVGLSVAALVLGFTSASADQSVGPKLEVVKSFDNFQLVGVAVSRSGRVFASAPSARSGDKVVEVDAATGMTTPFPDRSWNSPGSDYLHQWAVPQAMWVDRADHLWVLDSGRRILTVGQSSAKPKLVEFDLANKKVLRNIGFDGVVAPGDSLNDLRIDLVHGYAYLTNIGNKGSLVVVNLKTGSGRSLLIGDRSTYADPRQHLMIGNAPAEAGDGQPVAIHADGIAMSPDAKWIYYRPLTDHNYWRVPTAALIDESLSPKALVSKVEFLGSAELTGGLIMDNHGTLYGGDLEHSSVVALTLDPVTHKFKSRLFIKDPGKLSWADGFAISNGYLYIADSHLWEIAFKNHLPRTGPLTIFKARLPE